MTEFRHPRKLWKRYVDEALVIINRKYLQQFFKFLNAIEHTVQFTKK